MDEGVKLQFDLTFPQLAAVKTKNYFFSLVHFLTFPYHIGPSGVCLTAWRSH